MSKSAASTRAKVIADRADHAPVGTAVRIQYAPGAVALVRAVPR